MRTALLALTLAACAPKTLLSPAEPEPTIALSEAVQQFIATIHPRMQDHAYLPDREFLACLTGHVRGTTVHITGIVPTVLFSPTDRSLAYRPCPQSAIGTWHTHPTVPGFDTCSHSETDSRTLEAQDNEIVSLISCVSDGRVVVHALVKRGYSRR
jgi:hypothetical protein